jgi:hypothetical protein
VDSIDLAYAAGLFDGEGGITITKQKGKRNSWNYHNNTKPDILKEADAVMKQKISDLNRGYTATAAAE